jgi:hypothetical protein
MGLQIRCYVEGIQEFIDLYDDENITAEISFAEIQDITKKNSTFSQEFRVPGSGNNNQIFDYFFDINTEYLSFNPKKKFEADLMYDGYEIYNGYIRLNSVSINRLEKIYSITFYTGVGDLVSNIGDKGLCEVNTSSLNHSLYEDGTASALFDDPSLHPIEIIQTQYPQYAQFLTTNLPGWDSSVGKGDVQYFIGHRGYDYTGGTTGTIADIDVSNTPILNFNGGYGFFDNPNTAVPAIYLTPALRLKTLYELIVNQGGYQIQSDFFEGDYFKRYYLPLSFNTDQPLMNQAQEMDLNWKTTGLNSGLNFTGRTVDDGSFTTLMDIVEPQNIVDNLSFNPIDPTLFNGFGQYLFQIPSSPSVEYMVNFETLYVGTGSGSSSVIPVSTLKLYRFVSYNPISGQVFADEVDSTVVFAYDDLPGGIFQNTLQGTLPNNLSNFYYFLSYEPVFPTNTFPFSMEFKITSSPKLLPYTIELNKEMGCDKKQIDFITDINRYFNLVVVDHPFKEKTLIIEPLVNYIGKGETLDWTDKIDYNSIQSLFPTTTLINGSLFLANLKDQDFINSEYNKKSNLIFGQEIVDLGEEYKNQTIDLSQKMLGQNTDYYLNASGNTNVSIPCYFIAKEQENEGQSFFQYTPFRSLPRVSFLGVPIPSGNTGHPAVYTRTVGSNVPFSIFGLNPVGDFMNFNRLTTYPMALTGFSHYLTYDASTTFTDDELVYPELDTQYDRYYRDYIEDLISPDNKIYTAKAYLNPWELSQLYYNEKILIKNAFFRINKITNYSLVEPSLCDLELVKLTRDYTPTPKLCYDLVNCQDGCDIIHTNTDLVFPIWAFENKVVRITTSFDENGNQTTKLYKVIRTQCRDDVEYQKVWFTNVREEYEDYFVFYNYQIYDDCESVDADYTLDIINQTDPEYTQPSVCYSYVITNLLNTPNTFTFTQCDGTPSSWTLGASSSIGYCGLYGSFQGEGFDFCLDDTTICENPSPVPTNTPSSTPTSTPSSTPIPSPTRTPTNTPTPSPTEGFECILYRLDIGIEAPSIISYTSCSGAEGQQNTYDSGVYFLCAQPIPEFIQGGGTITAVGNCEGPTYSPTPTPSFTSTSTPSPTPTITPTNTSTPTSTSTPTPTPTKSANFCKRNIIVNVSQIGWVNFNYCLGSSDSVYLPLTGLNTITQCIEPSSLVGSSTLSPAVFTIYDGGIPC